LEKKIKLFRRGGKKYGDSSCNTWYWFYSARSRYNLSRLEKWKNQMIAQKIDEGFRLIALLILAETPEEKKELARKILREKE
jgi:hypothetical protein